MFMITLTKLNSILLNLRFTITDQVKFLQYICITIQKLETRGYKM